MDNKEKDLSKSPKNLPMILVGAALVVAVIVIALAMRNKNVSPGDGQPAPGQQTQEPGTVNQGEGDIVDASTPATSEMQQVQVPNVGTAQVVVPGANPITADNVVVTPTGEATVNEGITAAENAPRQTGFLNPDELPNEVPQLSVGRGRIAPSQVVTTAGSPTTFAWTSIDDDVHVFGFNDPSLSSISILVGPGQTKAITFNAPTTPGNYEFRCTSPTHAGETGTLQVR